MIWICGLLDTSHNMVMTDKLSEFTSETETYQTRYEKIRVTKETFLRRKSPKEEQILFCILYSDPFPLNHKAVTLGWAIYSLPLNLQKSIHESYWVRVTRTVKRKNVHSLILRPNIFYSGFPRKQRQRHSCLPRS